MIILSTLIFYRNYKKTLHKFASCIRRVNVKQAEIRIQPAISFQQCVIWWYWVIKSTASLYNAAGLCKYGMIRFAWRRLLFVIMNIYSKTHTRTHTPIHTPMHWHEYLEMKYGQMLRFVVLNSNSPSNSVENV